MAGQRFPIRFSTAFKWMAVLGMSPRTSAVEVNEDEVTVRLSWSFDARFPRSSIRSVEPDHDRVTGWGAHGWGGRWLVNGSSSGLVRITIDPEATAHVLGWPVRLRVLRVAVEDPEGLMAALGASA